MGFAWSHTTYAEWHDIIFNFEYKRDLSYFLEHSDAKRISAVDAWNKYHGTDREFIRVYASDALGANKDRKQRIKSWYENKRNRI